MAIGAPVSPSVVVLPAVATPIAIAIAAIQTVVPVTSTAAIISPTIVVAITPSTY